MMVLKYQKEPWLIFPSIVTKITIMWKYVIMMIVLFVMETIPPVMAVTKYLTLERELIDVMCVEETIPLVKIVLESSMVQIEMIFVEYATEMDLRVFVVLV